VYAQLQLLVVGSRVNVPLGFPVSDAHKVTPLITTVQEQGVGSLPQPEHTLHLASVQLAIVSLTVTIDDGLEQFWVELTVKHPHVSLTRITSPTPTVVMSTHLLTAVPVAQETSW
jgi:hypothetical protein